MPPPLHYPTACLCLLDSHCGSVSLFPSSMLAYTAVTALSTFSLYFTPSMSMKSALSAAVPLRCLQINCDPSYLLSTCFYIVCYCYGVVRAGFLLWRAWWRKHLMMIGALWQVSHQFIVWYMSPNIDSYCPQVFTVFGYSLERDLLSGASPSSAMLASSCQLLLLMNNMPRHCPSIVSISVLNQLCLRSLQLSLLMLLQPL